MGSQPAKNRLFEKDDQSIGTEEQIKVAERGIKVPHTQNEYFQNQDINESFVNSRSPQSLFSQQKNLILHEQDHSLELHINLKNTPENAKFLQYLAKQVERYQNHAQFSTDFSSQKSVSSILKRTTRNNSVDYDYSLRNISMPMQRDHKCVKFNLDEKKSGKYNKTKRMQDLRKLGLIASPIQKSRFRDA